jgi:hypothetical protein
MNDITSALVTRVGALSTTEKKTFRSKATARIVFGRARARRNSRYSSTSGWPTVTSHSPSGRFDLTTHGFQRMKASSSGFGYDRRSRPRITHISCEAERLVRPIMLTLTVHDGIGEVAHMCRCCAV